MVDVANDPNITDWITAIASVGAMVGTVGAVVFALWQVRRQGTSALHVTCERVFLPDMESYGTVTVEALKFSGYHRGGPPVKLTMASFECEDGRQAVVSFMRGFPAPLPVVLQHGESVDVLWRYDQVEELARATPLREAVFTDAAGGQYRALYPVGVRRVRRGLLRRRAFAFAPNREVGR